MSQYERDMQNARIAERKKAAAKKNKPVVDVQPEPLGILPGGTTTSPAVESARNAWIAEKQNRRDDAARGSRFQVAMQDLDTVGAVLKSWMSDTPEFIPTPFNKESIANAVNECLLCGDSISIKLLNDIHEYLLQNNHLQNAGHARRARGQGIMVGAPTIYPVYEPNQGVVVRRRGVATYRNVADDISATEARHMPLAELGARVRAMRSGAAQPPASTENISEADAREMPLSELRKVVQAAYGKGRQ
jgi:hypothetical protein